MLFAVFTLVCVAASIEAASFKNLRTPPNRLPPSIAQNWNVRKKKKRKKRKTDHVFFFFSVVCLQDESRDGANLGASPEMLRKRQTVPRTVDWTRYSAQLGGKPIALMRHQGGAGSCWVHSALSAAEANHNLLRIKLSNGAPVQPEYMDFSNALNCLAMRNEQTGRTPSRLTHPAEFLLEIRCSGRLPTLTQGRCGITSQMQKFYDEMNKFGEQYGVWITATAERPDENVWTLSSGLVRLADWRSVEGWETYEGRRDAAFEHFKAALVTAFGAAAAGTCAIEIDKPYQPIENGGIESRPHDWLAEQQRCVRHAGAAAGGSASEPDGECTLIDGKLYSFVPQDAGALAVEVSIDQFDGNECQLVDAAVANNSFSRYWSLAATWDRSQAVPTDDGFVSQLPYWTTYSPMDAYSQGRAAVEKLLTSVMATIDHGPATAAIQTCATFSDYKDTRLGRPIWHPDCDTLTPPKPGGDECAASGGGLHAVVVVGYYFAGFHRPLEESYFLVQNSWSADYGVGGFVRLAMGHFLLSSVTLPLLRDPQRLVNPLLPRINPAVAYSLPPTLFVGPDGKDVTIRKVGNDNVAQFKLDGSEYYLDVKQRFPDVAVKTVTITLASAPPADLDAVLGFQFSTTTPANRQMLPGVSVPQFSRGAGNTLVFQVPAQAASVPASSWFIAVVVSFKSAQSSASLGVKSITYDIDSAKSGAFLNEDKPKTDPSSATALAASLALIAAVNL